MGLRGVLGIAVAAAILPVGCADGGTGLPPLDMQASPGAYRLGPNDQVRIAVFGLDAITNTYLVDDTGTVALPMLDPVTVAGKTMREAEQVIAQRVRDRKLVLDPRVSVQIVGYRPFYISGEVARPGQYPYVPGMSLMTAVSIAGGYTFRAKRSMATVSRAKVKGRAGPDTPIMPGDMIVVPESWF